MDNSEDKDVTPSQQGLGRRAFLKTAGTAAVVAGGIEGILTARRLSPREPSSTGYAGWTSSPSPTWS